MIGWLFAIIAAAGAAALMFAMPSPALRAALRLPAAAAVSAWWLGYCLKFMVRNKDIRKRKGPQRPLCVSAAAGRGRRVRVVFVRHGESVWNSLFNRFGPQWPVRAAAAALQTVATFWLREADSVIVDTPLSGRGRDEALALAGYCRQPGTKMPLDPATSVVVCSNLRRAMHTAVAGLGPRLTGSSERVVVDSCLQEGSRNADAHSFMWAPGRLASAPVGHLTTAAAIGRHFDPSLNQGNKAPANVYDRIDQFALRLFGDAPRHPALLLPDGSRAETVVAVGHSLWFRNFFARFLPPASRHVAKTKKMRNCAAVAFDIVADPKTGALEVDERTIVELHLGFQK